MLRLFGVSVKHEISEIQQLGTLMLRAGSDQFNRVVFLNLNGLYFRNCLFNVTTTVTCVELPCSLCLISFVIRQFFRVFRSVRERFSAQAQDVCFLGLGPQQSSYPNPKNFAPIKFQGHLLVFFLDRKFLFGLALTNWSCPSWRQLNLCHVIQD